MGFLKKAWVEAKAAEAAKKSSSGSEKKSSWGNESVVVFKGMSRESGRNAKVTLYSDRIEREKKHSHVSVSKAAQEVEVTPIRTISSVKTEKDGFLYTKVTVYASGNNVEFKMHIRAC